MQNLTRAHDELFRRGPDERFKTFDDLWRCCRDVKEGSTDRWHPPAGIGVEPHGGRLRLTLADEGIFQLNDWSFSQLCSLAGASKETVNKLTPDTASLVFTEMMPRGSKPLQVFTRSNGSGDMVRSIHGASYTRLFDVDLLSMVREFATDFQPPQEAAPFEGDAEAPAESASDTPSDRSSGGGGTGLYRGEQDMFCFLIDPVGWAEINGEAFAPGFFLWNSEVGKRSVGVQTFWFQAVCQNHIVWDAVEVGEFSRKHTANVHEAFDEIRRIIERLAARRDERRDGFVRVIKKAMETRVGKSADEIVKMLSQKGITRSLAKQALEFAKRDGAFTIFSLVDALTRISGQCKYAGDRADVDAKASSLLALAV
ncbi:MAG: DUF932 domain-containing protein [Phycisphaerae bacterium]|nr:DUF932 domain-containing protein [Phycisphaerae bacterium]